MIKMTGECDKIIFTMKAYVLADAYCNQGWTQERGKCYRVFDTAVTWQQANRECDVLKSSLVTLNDIREQTFILQLRSTSADVNYWIGYNRNVRHLKCSHQNVLPDLFIL